MNGRRVTALLLTAFLVAEMMWHLQIGSVLPAVVPDVWSEVAQGAYRIAQGDYLVPFGTSDVLQRSAAGTARARATWGTRVGSARVNVYGSGRTLLGMAAQNSGAQVLQPYGKGFLFLDGKQNIWLVAKGRIQLLLGGGTGPLSRAAMLAQEQDFKQRGRIAKDWQLIWADDPLAVGQTVWFLTNRGGPLGAPGIGVWRLGAAGTGAVDALSNLGIVSLIASGPAGVLAEDAQGATLLIDPASYQVRARWTGTNALAIGQGGEALLLRAAPGVAPQLSVLAAGSAEPHAITLPASCTALGPASFSAQGQWLAMLVQRNQKELVYVVRVRGLGAGQAGDLFPPPAGANIAPATMLSIGGGRVYLVVRNNGTTQTWERSIGDGQAALGLHRLG